MRWLAVQHVLLGPGEERQEQGRSPEAPAGVPPKYLPATPAAYTAAAKCTCMLHTQDNAISGRQSVVGVPMLVLSHALHQAKQSNATGAAQAEACSASVMQGLLESAEVLCRGRRQTSRMSCFTPLSASNTPPSQPGSGRCVWLDPPFPLPGSQHACLGLDMMSTEERAGPSKLWICRHLRTLCGYPACEDPGTAAISGFLPHGPPSLELSGQLA